MGGVVLEEGNRENIEKSFDTLKKKLKVQSDLKEIKFKNICGGGSNFLKCISNRKLHDFIDWLLKNDIYVHFKMLDHLYYAIVDIIDSLDVSPLLENDLKTSLYQIVYNNTDNFQKGFNLLKSLLHKSYKKNGAFRNMSRNKELNDKFDKMMGF
ncbi:hypothetical protein ABEY41_11940 [Peribacillus butanolivorans]|uniref:hypothetical protein n=1 Tax=Peribacillus butanolivorans TaxID=421767 RepID=UPI003D2CFDD2